MEKDIGSNEADRQLDIHLILSRFGFKLRRKLSLKVLWTVYFKPYGKKALMASIKGWLSIHNHKCFAN